MTRLHPEVNIEGSVYISDPPEGGLAFADLAFRRELRQQVERLGIDLVVVDPWTHVGAKDDASEVMAALANIRAAVGSGEHAPGIVIVAHTKKPRAEDMRLGRGLVYQVSGSIALCNTARAVWVMLPWSHQPEDDRVLWTLCKLNDGTMYPASVWRRRFGTHFQHDDSTDPTTWGEESDGRGRRRRVNGEELDDAFQGREAMSRKELVASLVAAGVSQSAAYDATDPERGYLVREGRIVVTPHGLLARG